MIRKFTNPTLTIYTLLLLLSAVVVPLLGKGLPPLSPLLSTFGYAGPLPQIDVKLISPSLRRPAKWSSAVRDPFVRCFSPGGIRHPSNMAGPSLISYSE